MSAFLFVKNSSGERLSQFIHVRGVDHPHYGEKKDKHEGALQEQSPVIQAHRAHYNHYYRAQYGGTGVGEKQQAARQDQSEKSALPQTSTFSCYRTPDHYRSHGDADDGTESVGV